MKAGVLFTGEKMLARITGEAAGAERRIVSPGGELLLRTRIRCLPAPPERSACVQYRRYLLLDAQGAACAEARPDYAADFDPETQGWPVCRMPRIDRAALRTGGQQYLLVMHNSQNYALMDSGKTAVQVVHRGVTGGWDIDAPAAFSPALICGLFVFCRYLERENEWCIV